MLGKTAPEGVLTRSGMTASESVSDGEVARRISRALLEFVARVPSTTEPRNPTPRERARAIATGAALRASAASGTLALPPGPAGIVLILPELLTVWRIQSQMVADIAGAYGRSATLSREQMVYCLFKATAAQAVRDLVVRIGGQYVVQQTSLATIQAVIAKVGVKVSHKAIVKSVSRVLPVLGALGVAGYAYYDTAQVAQIAIEMFERER